MTIGGAPTTCQFRFRIVSEAEALKGSWNSTSQVFISEQGRYWIRIDTPTRVQWNDDGTFTWPAIAKAKENRPFSTVYWSLTYGSEQQADQYIANAQPVGLLPAKEVLIAPGFDGRTLPLPGDIMPSGFAWLPDGRLAFTTLKGQVLQANDSDDDGLEDEQSLVIDGLAAPYGLCQDDVGWRLWVADKTGLLECSWVDRTDLLTGFNMVASGWGHTDDYHDWAVGPVIGKSGERYIALPCQQDQRPNAAAAFRGRIISLGPSNTTTLESRSYNLETEIGRAHV